MTNGWTTAFVSGLMIAAALIVWTTWETYRENQRQRTHLQRRLREWTVRRRLDEYHWRMRNLPR